MNVRSFLKFLDSVISVNFLFMTFLSELLESLFRFYLVLIICQSPHKLPTRNNAAIHMAIGAYQTRSQINPVHNPADHRFHENGRTMSRMIATKKINAAAT